MSGHILVVLSAIFRRRPTNGCSPKVVPYTRLTGLWRVCVCYDCTQCVRVLYLDDGRAASKQLAPPSHTATKWTSFSNAGHGGKIAAHSHSAASSTHRTVLCVNLTMTKMHKHMLVYMPAHTNNNAFWPANTLTILLRVGTPPVTLHGPVASCSHEALHVRL